MKTVVVMLKEPRAGRVKTRLGRDIGMTSAAWWFRHQTRQLLRRIEDPRWRLIIAVTPDFEGLASRIWPPHIARVPQGRGNLGDRMGRIFRMPIFGPLCIIGADIPGVESQIIWRAFRELGNHDAVFGPSPDGGYWLIGMRRNKPIPRRIFEGVRWSSAQALTDTVATLPGHRIALVRHLRDVDTAADLAMTSPRPRDT